jgi:hypothetical protein
MAAHKKKGEQDEKSERMHKTGLYLFEMIPTKKAQNRLCFYMRSCF